MSWKLGLSLLSMCTVISCGEKKPAEVPPPPPPPPPPAETAPPPVVVPPVKEDDGSRGQLNISEDIRTACGITDAEALFAYDSASVRPGDHPVLDKLTQCFISGALAGRRMRLVGHADPRGDEEYNLVLGGRRAESVKGYLVRAGLNEAQGQTTSRGEMDAEGTDDASWVRDRRVDIVLAD